MDPQSDSHLLCPMCARRCHSELGHEIAQLNVAIAPSQLVCCCGEEDSSSACQYRFVPPKGKQRSVQLEADTISFSHDGMIKKAKRLHCLGMISQALNLYNFILL